MKASILIVKLKKMIKEYGDLDVYIQTFDGTYTDDEVISDVSICEVSDKLRKKMFHLDR